MKKYLAELIGTFALVFFGTGSIIVNQHAEGSLGLLGISIAFGAIVTAVIYVFGPISGAHINPAVTISLALGKLMPRKEVPGYLVAQCLGAIMASGALLLLFPTSEALGGTLPSGTSIQSFGLEFICTFFLMILILGITSKKEFGSIVGLIVGFLIIGLIMVSGPISGGSFNPARSLGPALLSGNFTSLWIYLIAPTLGAILAVLTWRAFHVKQENTEA